MIRSAAPRRALTGRGVATLLLTAPIVAGCAPTDSALLMAGASLVTFVTTDRTVSDHVIGALTDKDCSTLRMVNEGSSLCRDPAETAEKTAVRNGPGAETQMAATPRYCYRELGQVSCYDRPRPYAYRSDDAHTAQRP